MDDVLPLIRNYVAGVRVTHWIAEPFKAQHGQICVRGTVTLNLYPFTSTVGASFMLDPHVWRGRDKHQILSISQEKEAFERTLPDEPDFWDSLDAWGVKNNYYHFHCVYVDSAFYPAIHEGITKARKAICAKLREFKANKGL